MCLWARDPVVPKADKESMLLPEISIMSSHPFKILVLNLPSYLHPSSGVLRVDSTEGRQGAHIMNLSVPIRVSSDEVGQRQ